MKVYTDQPAVQIYIGRKTSNELLNKDSVEFHTEKWNLFLRLKVFPDAKPRRFLKCNFEKRRNLSARHYF